MAGGSWWEDSPSLRSLFPAIVNAASQGLTTAGVWQAIRDAASDMAEQVLSVTLGRAPTDDEVLAQAGNLLQGISATDVSSARGIAGQMVSAHGALSGIGTDQQITSDAIGRPPWATTTNVAGVSEQYRIRVQRQVSVKGASYPGRAEWATYNLTGPLTTIEDALRQANTLFEGADYNRAARIDSIIDYVIEAV